jgi:hypothetical protein
MRKKLEKTIIIVDDVVQKPLTYVPIVYNLKNSISSASTVFSLSGISSIFVNDILKIDNEYMVVDIVGFGTTTSGPISNIGNVPLVQVERGSLGTIPSSHVGLSTVNLYRGSYNIVGNNLYFAEIPLGFSNTSSFNNENNLPYPTSSFEGRVFLRQDYNSNKIFDDISDQFTGIGQTYRITYAGLNTTGVGNSGGNGILFINNVFQAPTTLNNSSNNFSISETNTETDVVFSGITSSNGSLIKSDFDVNQNQLPRGGLIVSLGSTSGLGFAPLVGVLSTSLNVSVGSGGSITNISFSDNNFGSGYYGLVSIGITDTNHNGQDAVITANVGAGGSLTSFNIINGGSGYNNPIAIVPEPLYRDLPVVGVSRLGIGSTSETGKGLLISLDVGSASTTGIGSTLFEVKNFKITRSGYGFKTGDVFNPIGLVTARGLSSPLIDFQLTVLETFQDSFYAWNFGELDYIDSIKSLQDGVRLEFPLFYNENLLSFESDPSFTTSLAPLLLVFINGVIQKPGVSYIFSGGTNITFTEAPKKEDNVSIFFYRGTRNVDSVIVNVKETIKIGDSIQILKNDLNSTNSTTIYEPLINGLSGTVSARSSVIAGVNTSNLSIGQIVGPIVNTIPFGSSIISIGNSSITLNNNSSNIINTFINFSVGRLIRTYDPLTKSQDIRFVSNIVSSDIAETNNYSGLGIDGTYFKPLTWEKQKVDKIINGNPVYKWRDSLEAQIYPEAKIIWDYNNSSNKIFVDNAEFFNYEEDNYGYDSVSGIKGLLVIPKTLVSAGFTAVVSGNGSISSINIINPGFGYIGTSVMLKISKPIGVGYTAIAVASVVNGSITNPVQIINSGSGYSNINPPQIIAPNPITNYQIVDISSVEGFSGIITGITTTEGTNGNPLAIKFYLNSDSFVGLKTTYPIYIHNTSVGFGLTSIINSDSQILGIGTCYLDNIYYISDGNSLDSSNTNAEIICNVKSNSNLSGISTYGDKFNPVGKFSWGIFYTSSTPNVSIGVSGFTISSGLSTYPSIQRRGYGLRDTGAIKRISVIN